MKYGVFLLIGLVFASTARAHVAANPDILRNLGLTEGDIVGSTAVGDPDIYIINEWGYKRLFLSPAIFGFYGHLRYDGVRRFQDTVIASMPVSALFRNCEVGDKKVYALEVTGEDVARLRWVDVTGEAAVTQDPDFFKRIFCINAREFAFYAKGPSYTALDQVPVYERAPIVAGMNSTGLPLQLPLGFQISAFASSLGPVRFMAFSPDGRLFVSVPSSAGLYGGTAGTDGKILALADRNGDGIAEEVKTVLYGLHLPHGLAFHRDYLYIAEEGAVLRYSYVNDHLGAQERIASLPTGGEHLSRTIGFSPSGKMYVSVGSPCNDCTTGAEGTAAIWEFNDDGTDGHVYARGIRNAVGFVFQPDSGQLWATENSRDHLGDDLPPDEINIVRGGSHYGWPYCYGRQVRDPKHPAYDCATTIPSVHATQAHSAPLGLRFIGGPMFPAAWAGDLLVARHGSWNRTQPVGYDIIRLDVEGSAVVSEQPFISGWLTPDGRKLGRPVDVLFGPDGALYASDDKANTIYRVTYRQP